MPAPTPTVETTEDPVAVDETAPEVIASPEPVMSEAEPPPLAASPVAVEAPRPQASAETMSLDLVRIWTSADGSSTVESVFQSYGQGVVTLERTDGEVIDVPLEQLSERDQALIRKGR